MKRLKAIHRLRAAWRARAARRRALRNRWLVDHGHESRPADYTDRNLLSRIPAHYLYGGDTCVGVVQPPRNRAR